LWLLGRQQLPAALIDNADAAQLRLQRRCVWYPVRSSRDPAARETSEQAGVLDGT
jgi:hypothetical protein